MELWLALSQDISVTVFVETDLDARLERRTLCEQVPVVTSQGKLRRRWFVDTKRP